MLSNRKAGCHDGVIVVASGPSAAGFMPPAGIPVIVVNAVVSWISRFDYWFTLDGSRSNLRHCRRAKHGVRYFAALPEKYPLPRHVVRLTRVAAGDSPGLSDMPGVIHSGNSAFGALGLAYQLGAKRVMLIGVDGTQERRVDGGLSGDLAHLPGLFESAIGQVEMVNCGKLATDRMPRMTVERGIAWVKG